MYLDEIYLAILTLAFTTIVFTIAFQWGYLTGGSDSTSGVIVTDLGIPDRQIYGILSEVDD